MALARSHLEQLTQPGQFFWATGIEDTFINTPWPATGRTLDEYELTGHYQAWASDLQLMRECGVRTARYGLPWHRLNPAPGQFEWRFADQTLSRLIELEIDPIVDLVHYGVPTWMEGAFLHPDFAKYMAEFGARLAERFRGRIHAYTPLNEPRITAWYCGKLGWWPPFRKGWRGFLEVMMAVARGIVLTCQAWKEIDEEIVPVHVDATDLYQTDDPALQEEVDRRQAIVFLALDLVSGRVDSEHSLYHWLIKNGVKISDLEWFQQNAIELPLIGINLYPMFSQKILLRKNGLRIRMPYAGGEIVSQLAEMYWERYRSPIFIAETASVGSVKRRAAWLRDSTEAVRSTREKGIPLVGYTWWPLFALVTWAYRQGKHPPAYYLKQMGLWDLQADSTGNLERLPTPLVEQFRKIVHGGSESAGILAGSERMELNHVS